MDVEKTFNEYGLSQTTQSLGLVTRASNHGSVPLNLQTIIPVLELVLTSHMLCDEP